MKILIIGRGVIGTQYAWALEHAGNEVTFYVRPGKKDKYDGKIKLNIYDGRKSLKGKLIKQTWVVSMVETLSADHKFELIIVSMPHYSFKSVAEFLSTRLNNATVLCFGNIWNEPLVESAALPQENVVWGFPRAGGGFDGNDILQGGFLGTVFLGTFGGKLSARDKAVLAVFKSAGFKAKIFDDFRSFLFIHFIGIAAMQLELLKETSKTQPEKLIRHAKFFKEIKNNLKELMPILNARNVDLNASNELKILSMPPWLISFAVSLMSSYSPIIKQSFGGHSNPSEPKQICFDVWQKGVDLHIPLPRFEANTQYFNFTHYCSIPFILADHRDMHTTDDCRFFVHNGVKNSER